MVEHLTSPGDQLALSQFNPGFKSLFVSGTSTLGPVTATSIAAPLVKNVTVIGATAGNTTLTVAQAGIVRIVPNTVAETITLPSVASASGLTYEFFWTGSADGSHSTTIASADTGVVNGGVLNLFSSITNNPVGYVSIATKTNITRVATANLTQAGDTIKFTSDGASWYVTGQASGSSAGTSWTTS